MHRQQNDLAFHLVALANVGGLGKSQFRFVDRIRQSARRLLLYDLHEVFRLCLGNANVLHEEVTRAQTEHCVAPAKTATFHGLSDRVGCSVGAVGFVITGVVAHIPS